VCLDHIEVAHEVVKEHLDSAGNTCPMSGQSLPLWDESATRQAVKGRSGGICEYCARRRATDMHHRMSRGVGGWWSPGNILHLCQECHRWATDRPKDAYARGVSVQRGLDPCDIAVRRYDGLILTIDDNVAPPC
jgi:5-methylcytosine-specific restriction endonuclease McrA